MRFVHDNKEKPVEVKLKSFGDSVEVFLGKYLVARFAKDHLQLFALNDEKQAFLDEAGVKTEDGPFPRGGLKFIKVEHV